MFDYIKLYFEMGLYTVNDLKVFVTAQMITADEFKELSNVEYTA